MRGLTQDFHQYLRNLHQYLHNLHMGGNTINSSDSNRLLSWEPDGDLSFKLLPVRQDDNKEVAGQGDIRNAWETSAKDREESDDDEDAGEDQPWKSVAGSVPGLLSLHYEEDVHNGPDDGGTNK